MKIKKKFVIIILLIILIIALFPRCIELLNKNYIFGFDQGRDYLAIKNIVVNHKLTLIGSEVGAGAAGLSGIFQGPFHYYFLSIPFFVMRGDPYSGIVLMFLFSFLSVIFSYFLGKKIFGQIGGLTTALLFAISPMFVAQARFTWNSNPSTIFILLAFYFIFSSLKKKNRDIFLSSFFSAFIYNFQFAISIPLSLSLIIFNIFINKLRSFRGYLFLFFGFVLGYLPMLLFEIRHGFMGIGGFVKYLFGSKNPGESFLPSQKLIVEHLSSFFNAFIDVFPKNIISPLILLLIVIVPAIYFFVKEKNTFIKKKLSFLFLLFSVYFFVFLFFRNAIWVYYLIALNVAYILLFAYSLSVVFAKKGLILKLFYLIFIIFVLFGYAPNLINVSVYDYKDYGGTAKIKGKIDAIDYIYNDAKGKNFGLYIFSPPIYTYPYDYILSWYGQNKYGYIPENNKNGLFYLLIEEDRDKPWRQKGWMETVVKRGKILWEKKLPSGFLIQKRIDIE